MANHIKLGDITIGDGHPAVIIPEACDNHLGSLAKAKEMAYAAKEAGARIIKWQLHLPPHEMVKDKAIEASKEQLSKWGSIWHFYEKFALPVDDHYKLKEYCDQIGIQYFCTPFSVRAAEILKDMKVTGFKIGSGESDDLPLIEDVASFGLPMIVSTGMTELADLDTTVQAVKTRNTPLALAHCMSIYGDHHTRHLNYGLIPALKARYHVPVGLSDHTPPDPIANGAGTSTSHEARIWGAIHQGANFIEKHYTLDRSQPDADSVFSITPKDLKELLATTRAAEEALGNERKVFKEEVSVAKWAKRSVVAKTTIKKGTVITRDMLTSKRPGTGIRSKDYQSLIGKTAVTDIMENTLIEWNQLA